MGDRLAIPFRGESRDIYAVYYAPSAHRMPSAQDLQAAARSWRDSHLRDPLKVAVAAYFERGFVTIQVQPVESLPQLPIELLRHMGLGEQEERVVRSARHAALIMTQDLNIPPRSGLWSALSAALGIAEMLDGVIFDPDALRVIGREEATEWFSPMGVVSASQHIIVPFSVDESGLGWMTTRGLQKFGLPDVELKQIPPHLQRLGHLMNSVAQLLIEAAFRAGLEKQGQIAVLPIDREVVIDSAVVRRAHGELPQDVAADAEIKVGLEFEPPKDEVPFVDIVRPRDVMTDQGEWLYAVMKRLIPIDDVPYMASSRSEELAAAHQRAVAEIPQIRARFQKGLPPGEFVVIKHGFPTPNGDKEYMWVTVVKWKDGKISGQLSNIPNDVPALSLGQMVTILESEVFDWILKRPQGVDEGGYTNEVVMRQREGGA